MSTPSRLKPFVISARNSTPSTVRQIAPRPPATLVPPTTTAANAANTTMMPSPAWPVAVREDEDGPADARGEAADR